MNPFLNEIIFKYTVDFPSLQCKMFISVENKPSKIIECMSLKKQNVGVAGPKIIKRSVSKFCSLQFKYIPEHMPGNSTVQHHAFQ